MSGIPVRMKPVSFWALMVTSALLLWVLAGCGGSAGTGAGDGSLRGSELDQAQRLYAQLKREHSLQRDRKSLDLAASLLDYYPAFDRNDEVLLLAVESSARLRDYPRAVGFTDELLSRYPGSLLADQALLQGAEAAVAGRDTVRAAEYLIVYHERDPARSFRADGRPRASIYLEELNVAELDEVMTRHGQTSLWTYLGFLKVRAGLAERRQEVADDMAAQLSERAPADPWTKAALDLVGAGGTPPRLYQMFAGSVKPDRIGIMVPLTGRYAVLGNAFYDAALLAAEAANLEYGTTFSLQLEDTGADPVMAALAARKLCGEDGSIAVMGGLLSDPTAATAVVCDMYGVPLISPTATNDNIWQLGPGIFQTNITGLYEVRLLAELATSVMLKQRFGIIHPDTPEGRRHAQVFTDEVEARGGEIVAVVGFPPQGTDFKDPIQQVREARPEVIFAPASVDQMVLLGPQLDFYRTGALVMGLSNWNSNKLRDRSATVLERAVFPDDLVLFPAVWEDEFVRVWNTETYPPEASALALKVYQSTRMLLDTLVKSGAVSHAQLATALTRRLSHQDLAVRGPDSFGPTIRMFVDKQIVPFPAGLFAEGWLANEGAAADSTEVPLPGDPDEAEAPFETTPEATGRG